MKKSWPALPEWLEASTKSKKFLDEYSLIHGFVGWKMAQLWGFWPAVMVGAVYDLVLDPLRHSKAEQPSSANTAGDLFANVLGAWLGSKYPVK